ncbi:MAG: hypothetical protein FWE67_00380, partial [Planctomycetaceae bacterium]|nr:hypothetical protein [Planctomycetaceae bacterium]
AWDTTTLAPVGGLYYDWFLSAHPKHFTAYTYGNNFNARASIGFDYSNLFGNSAIAFDPLGNNISNLDGGAQLEYNPYLFNPYDDVQPGVTQAKPFTVTDIEPLLRSFGDKGYDIYFYKPESQRIRTLIDGNTSSNDYINKLSEWRQVLTTRSSDIPAPSRLTKDNTGNSTGLLAALYGPSGKIEINGTVPAALRNIVARLLSGNGINPNKFSLPPYADWVQNPPAGDPNALLKEKMKFARDLFYLVMILRYDEFFIDVTNDTDIMLNEGGKMTRKEAIKRVAQWAVNVVDFCDNDAIMTPLVYSTNPFSNVINDTVIDAFINGTGVFNPTTPTYNTNYGIVWGMENPEVAITETLAVHNRRVADSIKESGTDDVPDICTTCNKDKRRLSPDCSTAGVHDTTFDQVLIPEGSLFIELYRNGNPNRKCLQDDGMYLTTDYTGTPNPAYLDNGGQLDLAAQTTGNCPIWRLVIGSKGIGTVSVSTNWSASTTRTHDALAQAVSDTTGTYSFQPKKQFPGAADVNVDGCDIEPERIIWFGAAPTLGAVPFFPTSPNIERYSFSTQVTAAFPSEKRLAMRANSYLVIAPRLFTSFQSKPVDGTTVKTFGTPSMIPGTYIDLTSAASFSTPELGLDTSKHKEPTAVAIAYARRQSSLTDSILTWWDTVPTGNTWANDGTMMGFGINVSEPLPNGQYLTTSPLSYYVQPTVAAATELKSKLCNSNIMLTFNFNNGYSGTDAAVPTTKGGTELSAYGTIPCYKTIMLQRIADPKRNYHPVINPYITVDWNMIDLHVINSEKDANSEIKDEDEPGIEKGTLYFTSRQWGYTGACEKNRPNLWTRCVDLDGVDSNPDYAGLSIVSERKIDDVKDIKFEDLTLGYLNKHKHLTAAASFPSPLDSALYKGAPDKAFMHFPWYDAPLNNSYELMLVPSCSPGRFGVEFEDSEETDWATNGSSLGGKDAKFRQETSDIGMYFNYFDSSTNSLNLAELFEWIRVPSKFNCSYKLTNGVIQTPYYTGREPGKININTANEAAWNALRESASRNPLPDFEELKKKRSDGSDDNFATPFRSPSGFDPNTDETVGGNASLFGENTVGDDTFLGLSKDKNDNWLAATQPMLQLGDMTTTRSNVFAVWITIGFFEAEEDNSNINIPVTIVDGVEKRYKLGKEKGLDNGTVKRGRAFYLIDRSIPVGFRRGVVFEKSEGKPQYKDVILKEVILE